MSDKNVTKKNLVIFQGDTFNRTLKFTNSSGNAIDISNWIIYFTVKLGYQMETNNDSNAIIKKTYPVGNGTSGTLVISLTKEETSAIKPHNYKYDIKIKRPGNIINTILYGDFLVVESVTKEY